MRSRRKFIRDAASGLLVLGASSMLPIELLAGKEEITKITILHTNDLHSRIEPFPMDGGKYQGLGGAARRAALIKNIRQNEDNVLLLDCGDILQGTPYFNFYRGEIDFKLLNEMGYDAATLGNHDFDAGMDQLAHLLDQSSFQMLNANYNLSDTAVSGKTKPYHIFEKQGVKIGVLGVGIELNGLVPPHLYGDTQYHNPIKAANETADLLRNEHSCELIICLSHLGYQYDGVKPSDILLAAQSSNIDLILGGHTHTFLNEPTQILNTNGQQVLINQVGWAGIRLGRLDFYFANRKKTKQIKSRSVDVK